MFEGYDTKIKSILIKIINKRLEKFTIEEIQEILEICLSEDYKDV